MFDNDNNLDIDDFIDSYGNYELSFLGIKFETKNLSIPILSIIMGLIDGISICSILVLLILINILVKMELKKIRKLKDNTNVGKAIIYLGDKKIHEEKIYVKIKKEKKESFFTKFKKWLGNLW